MFELKSLETRVEINVRGELSVAMALYHDLKPLTHLTWPNFMLFIFSFFA